MKKLSDYTIISDVDGTLLPHYGTIPARNIEALNRFVKKGGHFCIATGRSKELTEEFVKLLPVNAPCVLYNGGALYDFEKGEFLMRYFLPESAKEDLFTIQREVPGIPVMVISGGDYFNINDELPFAGFSEAHREKSKSVNVKSLQNDPWYKVLFSVTAKEGAALEEYVSSKNFKGVRFVHTNEHLMEMLPEFSHKGFALERMVELGHVSRENIAAIGDFYNDFEMIEYAGIGATVAAAPDDIKAVADFVAGTCENGAVADLVEYLESITL